MAISTPGNTNYIHPNEIRFNTLKEYDPDYTFTNLIPNADMKTGWGYSASSDAIPKLVDECSIIKMTGTTSSLEQCLPTSSANIPLINTHKYYVRVYAYQPTKLAGTSIGCYWPIAEPPVFEGYAVKDAGKWQLYSGINTRSTFTDGNYQLRFDFNNNKVAGNTYFTCPMLIDLTAIFGSGKEPTLAWCGENIPFAIKNGYIYTNKLTNIKSDTLTTNEFIETDTVSKIFADKIHSNVFIEE